MVNGHSSRSLLSKHKRDWDDLGRVDPLWAILTDSQQRYGKWNVEAFFATGAAEIAHLMEQAGRLGCPVTDAPPWILVVGLAGSPGHCPSTSMNV